ncbi:molybdopterin-dependent oxidoreductase [Bradyrhizobium mercantei]|uniref:molybdopterin-dependent oxidoreductase n=1 Tax=Bradyrhizobium mercantei TaxID=1904807 RepID=UPI000977B027|nr:molybdopterin-dependent oxidoreductase [Bradyrhizobium mercantei]
MGKRYTSSHWGIYEVEEAAGRPVLKGYHRDPDPSEIGLHFLTASQHRCRVVRPAVRESWLREGPGARTEGRGREPFVEVEWNEALDLIAQELERVRRTHGNASIFGGSYGWSSAGRFHHAQSQIHRFLNTIGGYVRHRDSYSIGAVQVFMRHVLAPMSELEFCHTTWPILRDHTRLFVAFGGLPIKNAQVSSGGAARHRVKEGIAAMAAAGCKFVNISPVRDNLVIDGVDVEWIPLRPNTDVALMLALAYVLETEGLADRSFLKRCTTGYEIVREYLIGGQDGTPKTPEWASNICGVPGERIRLLARQMQAQRTMMNVAWSLQRAVFGEQPYWGVILVASMLGQIGLPGGGFGVGYGMTNSIGSPERSLAGPTLPQGANPVREFIPVARIADLLLNPGTKFTYDGMEYTYPNIRFIYWAGGNPFHHHQDLNRLRSAWERPETIVVHEQVWTATAKRADIVLPVTTTLERNDISFANREGYLVAMRQIVEPNGEARDDYEIFSRLAERLGTQQAFTEDRNVEEWLKTLYEDARTKWGRAGVEAPSFNSFWEQGLFEVPREEVQRSMLEEFRRDPEANPLATPSGLIELYSSKIDLLGLPDCTGHVRWQEPPEWLGSEKAKSYPLHLLSDQPVRRLHSQLDHSDWSRRGKIADREAVFIHPDDARERGIRHGDVVMIHNERGRCLAGAHVSDVIMRGVVRLATGAWYDPDPDDDLEKHGNPNVLTLDTGSSGLSQGCSAQTCLVEISGPVADPPPVTAFEPPRFTTL